MRNHQFQTPFIKVCGLTRLEDAVSAAELGAAAIGFVAYRRSPRYIAPEEVSIIAAALPPEIIKVGVFVNPSAAETAAYAAAGLDVVQLHGDESADFAAALGLDVWKAVRPRVIDDINAVKGYPATLFVIDAFSAKGYGGTGELADWGLAAEAVETLDAPVILAGGLESGNVIAALDATGAAGIDVSSGVESAPGVKDINRLRAFFAILRTQAACRPD